MLWWVLTTAWADGLQAHSTRRELPSREVERAVVLQRGWRELQLTQGAGGGTALVRAGLADGLEVHARVGWLAHDELGLGATIGLWRIEPPNTSVAVHVDHSLGPVALHRPQTRAVVVGRQQWGGLLLTSEAGAAVAEAGVRPVAGAELALQAGPFVWATNLDEASWGLRGAFELTRGFEIAALFDEHDGWSALVVGRY